MRAYRVILTFGRTEITLDNIYAESKEAALVIAGMRLSQDGVDIRNKDKIEVACKNQEWPTPTCS